MKAIANVLTGLVAFAHLLARRIELAALRERAAARDGAHGARAGEAPWAT